MSQLGIATCGTGLVRLGNCLSRCGSDPPVGVSCCLPGTVGWTSPTATKRLRVTNCNGTVTAVNPSIGGGYNGSWQQVGQFQSQTTALFCTGNTGGGVPITPAPGGSAQLFVNHTLGTIQAMDQDHPWAVGTYPITTPGVRCNCNVVANGLVAECDWMYSWREDRMAAQFTWSLAGNPGNPSILTELAASATPLLLVGAEPTAIRFACVFDVRLTVTLHRMRVVCACDVYLEPLGVCPGDSIPEANAAAIEGLMAKGVREGCCG